MPVRCSTASTSASARPSRRSCIEPDVLGRFCPAAESDDGRRWTLTTVGPDLGDPQPIELELPPALAGSAAT